LISWFTKVIIRILLRTALTMSILLCFIIDLTLINSFTKVKKSSLVSFMTDFYQKIFIHVDKNIIGNDLMKLNILINFLNIRQLNLNIIEC